MRRLVKFRRQGLGQLVLSATEVILRASCGSGGFDPLQVEGLPFSPEWVQFGNLPAEETTANLCLGTSAAVREKVDGFFTDLTHRREEVKRRCRTVLQAKADESIGSTQANSLRSASVVFTLASV